MPKKLLYLPICGRKQPFILAHRSGARGMGCRLMCGTFIISCDFKYATKKMLSKFMDSIPLSSYPHDIPFYIGEQYEGGVEKQYIYIFGVKTNFETSNAYDLGFLFKFLRRKSMKAFYQNLLIRVIKDYETKGYSFPKDIEIKQSITTASSYYGVLRKRPREPNKYKLDVTALLSVFNPDIIYAIMVHEVAHIFVWGHTKKFHRLVEEICPNYDYLLDCLKKGYINGKMGELNEANQ